MRLNRVFIDEPLAPDSLVTFGGTAANHVLRVMRLGPGDPLTLFDGRGGEYEAIIDGLRKDAVLARVGAHRAVERESPLSITLAQGISRGERMDLVIQKATELGVHRIVPLITERTVVRLDAKQADSRLRHWRAIAVSACEQCGRDALPRIETVTKLAGFLAAHDPQPLSLVLSPVGELRVKNLPDAGRATLLIGPEGGLDDPELAAAHRAGFRGLRLGPRILRTETAAIAAMTAIQLHLGDIK